MKGRITRSGRVVALALGLAVSIPLAQAAAAQAASGAFASQAAGRATGPPVSAYSLAGPRQVTNPRFLTAASRHPQLRKPFLPRDARAFAAAKQRGATTAGRTSGLRVLGQSPAGSPSVPRTSSSVPATGTTIESQGFSLTDRNAQVATLGAAAQSVEPPDTQLAAGRDDLVEMVNSSMGFFRKDGTRIAPLNDLSAFFQLPQGFAFTDPRIIYDAPSGRWFASGLGFNASFDSELRLAVSTTQDPMGSWLVYVVAGNRNGVIDDQPKLGLSDDKVVISWNDFTCPTVSTCNFTGQETAVLQKADLLAGANFIPQVHYGPDGSRFGIVPSQSMSTTGPEYMTYNNGAGANGVVTPWMGVVAITGTPVERNVSWNEVDLTITPTAIPPRAQQPVGGTLNTDDDRLLSATWRDGILWTSGNDACQSPVRACSRLIEINTGAPSLQQEFDLGSATTDFYYPAVTTDRGMDMFATFTLSSSNLPPAGGSLAVPAGNAAAAVLGGLGTTNATTNWSYNSTNCGGRNLWGDYSSAAVDPVNPMDVWGAAEWVPGSDQCDWGTTAARLTLAAPQVSSVCPDRGPSAGGTQVNIYGHDFALSTVATGAYFGTAQASQNGLVSTTQMTAASPGGTAGASVPVTVKTADGQGPFSGAPQFAYEPSNFVFADSPIACDGGLAAGQAKSTTLTASGGSVYLSFSQTCGGGTASVVPASGPNVPLNGTPQKFTGTSVTIQYTAPARLPVGGSDVITAQDAIPTTNPIVLDRYTFATRVEQYTFSSGLTGGLTVLPQDGSGRPVTCAVVDLSFRPTSGGGSASVNGTPLSSSPQPFNTGSGSSIGVTYSPPQQVPVNGGTDMLIAADDASFPQVVGEDTRTFTPNQGYWMAASDGGIFTFGQAKYFGSTGNIRLNQPIVGMARTPDDGGYWLVASDGGIFTFGSAKYFGSTGNIRLNQPIVGMASTPDGQGYWLVASDGGIFNFGNAPYLGSTGNIRLNKPVVGMAATPDGGGYWLVATDGGIFTFGDAAYLGSTGNIRLNKPIVGMAPTPDGGGYWLVASDGGIFTFGDARYLGSTGNIVLNKPIVGMAASHDGRGYWLVASDGGIFTFGDALYLGSTGNIVLNKPIVGMAAS